MSAHRRLAGAKIAFLNEYARDLVVCLIVPGKLLLAQISIVRFVGFMAIPPPIKLYVALRVGVAVILSQRPTPGTIEYSTNRFCWETYVLAGVLKSQVFKLCFGAKIFVPGKKLAKLREEEDRRSQPAPTVGPTAPTVGPMQVSVHREIFNFSWHVAKSVLSSTVRR